MSIITKMLRQDAVYWPLAGVDSGGVDMDAYGQPIASDPVKIDCRWVDKAVQFSDAVGETRISHSVVYVDRDVVLGGFLMLGVLDDVTDEDVPLNNVNAWEIKRFDKTPNLKNTEFLRTAYL